jgi:chitodextrinase
MLYWSNPFPIYDATYIFKVYPQKKTGTYNYYTTFFWGNNGTFIWDNGNANTYYGAHPYPVPAPTGPGQWEISVDSRDYVTGTEVGWGRWYTQAFRAWRESPSITHHEFYYDWPDTSKVISTTITDSNWASKNPPTPAIVMGQAPNLNGASWGGYPGWEEFNGIIRGIQIYSGLLSLADIQSEITAPESTSAGQNLIWYLNTDPRPSDVTDKKNLRTPHNPSWDGTTAMQWSNAAADTQAPTTPNNLIATGGVGSTSLSWNSSSDNVGVVQYNVYRSTTSGFAPSSSNKIGQSGSAGYTDFVASGTYYYVVTAQDAAGNVSGASNQTSATVSNDNTAPTAPSNLTATAVSSSEIDLSWSASTDNVAVSGYRIFRNGTQIGTATATSYHDTGAAAASTYTYTVSAFDASGNTSPLSQPQNATTPAGSGSALPTGLIAAYSFNEATGTTTADGSTNGNTGTLTGSAAWTTGKYGSAVSYNGTTSYVSVSNAFDISTVPFTIAAWVNPTNYSDYRKIFSKRDSWTSSGMRVDLTLYTSSGRVTLEQPNSLLQFSYAPPVGTWTHIAVVARSTGTDLYVNGSLQETTGAFTPGTSSSAAVRIGRAGDGQDPFLGAIDNLRIYNRSLSASEIQTDMNTPTQ